MRYLLNPLPGQKKARVSGPYSESLIKEMVLAKTVSVDALICPENGNDWKPISELCLSLQVEEPDNTEDVIHKLTPFIQAIQEDNGLRSWFYMLEHKSIDFRNAEFERLAQHTVKQKSTKQLAEVIRLLKNQVVFTIALRTARK
jgi:hypothetical protein